LKREGRFVVLLKPVFTSARRFRTLSGLQLPAFIARMVFSPLKMFTARESVEKIWYDSNREGDDKISDSLGVKVSNGIALLIMIALLTGPLWNFVPWSLTPRGGPLGKIRLGIAVFSCHMALVLWPFAMVLLNSLLQRKHWLEWIKLAALFAFCVWQGWGATRVVIWFWAGLYHWLAHFHHG